MAEVLKDAEDRFLESVLAADAIADDGFSARLVRRLQRRLWLRRLVLPCALALGGLIAYWSLADIAAAIGGLLSIVSPVIAEPVADLVPSPGTLLMAGLLFISGILGLRITSD